MADASRACPPHLRTSGPNGPARAGNAPTAGVIARPPIHAPRPLRAPAPCGRPPSPAAALRGEGAAAARAARPETLQAAGGRALGRGCQSLDADARQWAGSPGRGGGGGEAASRVPRCAPGSGGGHARGVEPFQVRTRFPHVGVTVCNTYSMCMRVRQTRAGLARRQGRRRRDGRCGSSEAAPHARGPAEPVGIGGAAQRAAAKAGPAPAGAAAPQGRRRPRAPPPRERARRRLPGYAPKACRGGRCAQLSREGRAPGRRSGGRAGRAAPRLARRGAAPGRAGPRARALARIRRGALAAGKARTEGQCYGPERRRQRARRARPRPTGTGGAPARPRKPKAAARVLGETRLEGLAQRFSELPLARRAAPARAARRARPAAGLGAGIGKQSKCCTRICMWMRRRPRLRRLLRLLRRPRGVAARGLGRVRPRRGGARHAAPRRRRAQRLVSPNNALRPSSGSGLRGPVRQ